MPNLFLEQGAATVTLCKEGYSGHAVARKISNCVVQNSLRKVQETGTVHNQAVQAQQRLDKIGFSLILPSLTDMQRQET